MADVILVRTKFPSEWAHAASAALSALDLSFIHDGDLTAIKVHVGESIGTALPSTIAHRAVLAVVERGASPFLTDTSVLYKSPRSTGVGHAGVAAKHGFGISGCAAPFIPADGIDGSDDVAIPVPNGEVHIARAICDADSTIVISHATGHAVCGFGGTLKNLGMGCASRKGKLSMHSATRPYVKNQTNRCRRCGECLVACPAGVIGEHEDGQAKIDPDRCIGCGECLTVCRHDAIGFKWNAESLDERIAEYALGAVTAIDRRVAYLIGIVNVTRECDCVSAPSEFVCGHVGFAASLDPVALDQAACDLTGLSCELGYAEKLGLGSRAYTLKELPPVEGGIPKRHCARCGRPIYEYFKRHCDACGGDS